MKRNARRAVLAGLASAAVMTSLTVGATSASAINQVNCGSDFLKLTIHGRDLPSIDVCFANAGEAPIASNYWWVTKIETGNNRVQWLGDGRWQPDQPIGKWTTFTWPNHPGGVSINAIRIL
ncbi:beta/gamma crystallin domain-containing protein [Streptomyces fumanus]|uniref:beta/gamma crystallin domain-containing protein n=1 Tax=Streptomyces fumanus TaxID=67302 RepID=UPI0033F4F720